MIFRPIFKTGQVRHEYGFHAWSSKTIRKHDSIFVVVNHFSKMIHFLSWNNTSNASKIAQFYFDGVVKLYGLRKIIVSDRDVKFMNYFWKTLWHKMRTKLKIFTAHHPQTDGQIEVINKSLKNLLRCLIREHLRIGISSYPLQNLLIIVYVISQKSSPFEVVPGYKSRKHIDLIPMTTS